MAVILLGTIDVTALGAASAGAASAARRLLQSRDSTAIAPCSPSLEPCDRDHTVRVQPRNLQSAIDVRPAWPLRGLGKSRLASVSGARISDGACQAAAWRPRRSCRARRLPFG